MRKVILLASLVTLLPLSAGAETITQTNAINIAAVVRINGGPVTVNQNGARNYAGVIQAGVNPYAKVTQIGTVGNSPGVLQSGRNMTANVTQVGYGRASNFAVIAQHHRR